MAANIIIDAKFCSHTIEELASTDFKLPMAYDGDSLKNTITILKKYYDQIKLISYYDFKEKDFSSGDIFIVTQWILNRFKDKELYDALKKKVNSLTESGNHFILMHHFWPYFIFKDVLDIDYYRDGDKEWFQRKFRLNLINDHPTLLNIDTFLDYNSKNLRSDEFTFLFKTKVNSYH